MKRLKFVEPLPALILAEYKDTTWRINDDKDITCNDELSCSYLNGDEFAKAKVLWTKETTFANLTEEDKEGHEPFDDEKHMLEIYSKYYNTILTRETRLKVIKFKIIK
jgi:hypothetical protein